MSKFLPINLYIRQGLLYPLTSPFLPPENKVEKDYSYAAGKKIGTLAAGTPYGIPKTGQLVEYTTGDDGHYQAGHPFTGNHFTDNGNGTITDNSTGLMWIKDYWTLAGMVANKWEPQLAFCESLIYAGHDDWRMPNIKELITLMDFSRYTPCTPAIFVNAGSPTWLWTGTTIPYNTAEAYVGSDNTGFIRNYAKATYSFRTIPVRLGLV